MARESREAKTRRARRIVALLEKAMPEAKIALDYADELQLLVAVMLSAQCTDAVVNTVTPALSARYPTAADYARASPEELMEMIRRVGLFRTKARNLGAAMKIIAEGHQGTRPGGRGRAAGGGLEAPRRGCEPRLRYAGPPGGPPRRAGFAAARARAAARS